jgi:hypothetical protein
VDIPKMDKWEMNFSVSQLEWLHGIWEGDFGQENEGQIDRATWTIER